MKLYYLSTARISHEQAHGIQIIKMCEAFASTGNEVVLVLPSFGKGGDVYAAYGVKKNFSVKYVPTIALPFRIPGAFACMVFTFSVSALLWLSRQPGSAVIYTRGEVPLLLQPFLPKRFDLVWETHIKPKNFVRYGAVAKRARAIVAVTTYYAKEIPSLWNIDPKKVFYWPDGVDLESFNTVESKDAARARLGLPIKKKIVLYAGRIDSWKGVDLLLEAATLLPEDTLVAIIGGTDAQVSELSKKYPAVRFLGTRPYSELPNNQAAADVLVLTGDANSKIAQHYTSPLKLFTYMASGVPIVAADLPSFREIISDKEAYWYEPNVSSLAEVLKSALIHTSNATARADAAKEKAKDFSWESRAKAIVAHIKNDH